jgi:hypothetical protein
MYLLIRYPGGIVAEGVVLAKGENRLRVAVAGFPDIIELKRIQSGWIDAGQVQVEFDFLLSDKYQVDEASSSKTMAAAAEF